MLRWRSGPPQFPKTHGSLPEGGIMLRAKILRIDGSIVADEVAIRGENAKRGTHDGKIWRGVFSLPTGRSQVEVGDTLILVPSHDHAMSAVVISIECSEVHFRAPGRMPTSKQGELESDSRSDAAHAHSGVAGAAVPLAGQTSTTRK
jgi:hypothetical protein